MSKYKELYEAEDYTLADLNLQDAIESVTTWEDGYWLSKLLLAGDFDISDEKIIDTLEFCFFAGLTISSKEIFFDANECLAKLYIRYGFYNEAASKLMLLAYNYECPDWVHLYLATTQLHTMFERLAEEPKFFFERLLSADFENYETRCEMRSIFGKYLCLLVEKKPTVPVASLDIIRFAEKLRFTASEEFRAFHQACCPELDFMLISDESEDIERLRESELAAKNKASELEAELSRAKKIEEEYQLQLQKQQEEMLRLQREKEASAEQHRTTEETYRDTISSQNSDIAKLEGEKSLLAARLLELEKAQKTALLPQNIDDVYLKITSWLNCSLRRYLAQWLTNHFERNCRGDYWSKKVKPALHLAEQKKFDSYKELVDFALDAVLNIYYYNFNDFYPYNSMGKSNDLERIKEMQQIRNRWVGHFEENNWDKEHILFDLDTIIEFTEQIEMPHDRRQEYIDFRRAVEQMQ